MGRVRRRCPAPAEDDAARTDPARPPRRPASESSRPKQSRRQQAAAEGAYAYPPHWPGVDSRTRARARAGGSAHEAPLLPARSLTTARRAPHPAVPAGCRPWPRTRAVGYLGVESWPLGVVVVSRLAASFPCLAASAVARALSGLQAAGARPPARATYVRADTSARVPRRRGQMASHAGARFVRVSVRAPPAASRRRCRMSRVVARRRLLPREDGRPAFTVPNYLGLCS
jgi:hypothetical protein